MNLRVVLAVAAGVLVGFFLGSAPLSNRRSPPPDQSDSLAPAASAHSTKEAAIPRSMDMAPTEPLFKPPNQSTLEDPIAVLAEIRRLVKSGVPSYAKASQWMDVLVSVTVAPEETEALRSEFQRWITGDD